VTAVLVSVLLPVWNAAATLPACLRSVARQTETGFECPIAHPTLLVRAEVLRAFPYRDLGWAEDYDLIRSALSHMRYREGVDYVCAA